MLEAAMVGQTFDALLSLKPAEATPRRGGCSGLPRRSDAAPPPGTNPGGGSDDASDTTEVRAAVALVAKASSITLSALGR
jgi:hypothetical protein